MICFGLWSVGGWWCNKPIHWNLFWCLHLSVFNWMPDRFMKLDFPLMMRPSEIEITGQIIRTLFVAWKLENNQRNYAKYELHFRGFDEWPVNEVAELCLADYFLIAFQILSWRNGCVASISPLAWTDKCETGQFDSKELRFEYRYRNGLRMNDNSISEQGLPLSSINDWIVIPDQMDELHLSLNGHWDNERKIVITRGKKIPFSTIITWTPKSFEELTNGDLIILIRFITNIIP